ncbi:MAG: helicase-associated domain-containing protein [Candidatus Thermoplasmatota archaeon]
MQLKELLQNLSEEEIKHICMQHNVKYPGKWFKHEVYDELRRIFLHPNTFKRAYHSLWGLEVAIVDFVIKQKGECQYEEIKKELGEVPMKIVQKLQNMGLLFPVPDIKDIEKLVLPDEYLFMWDVPSGDPKSLIEGLKSYQSEEIKKIARHLRCSDSNNAAGCASDVYHYVIRNRDKLINNLSPSAKKIWNTMIKNGGYTSISEFIHMFHKKDKESYYQIHDYWMWGVAVENLVGGRYYSRQEPQDYFELFLTGLLIPIMGEEYVDRVNRYAKYIAIPSEIFDEIGKEYFRELHSKFEKIKNEKLKYKEKLLKEIKFVPNDFALNDALKKYFLYCINTPPEIKLDGRISKRSLKKISKNIGFTEKHISFLNSFAIENQLVEHQYGRYKITKKAANFFNSSIDEYIEAIKKFFQTKVDKFTHTTALSILKTIEKFEGIPINIGELLDYIKFDEGTRDAMILYSESFGQLWREPVEIDDNVDSTFNNTVIEVLRLLHWSGLIDVSDSDLNSKDTYVKLSELGNALLTHEYVQLRREHKNMENNSFVVQPNMEIIALLNMDFSILQTLCQFTTIKNIDKVLTVELTKDSILRGVDSGLNLTKIYDLLSEYSKNPLPQNIEYFIKDMEKREEEITLIPCSGYLKVKDKFLTEELRHREDISKYLGDLITDEVIALRENVNLDALETHLKKKGYFVKTPKDSDKNEDENTSLLNGDQELKSNYVIYISDDVTFPNPAYEYSDIKELLEFAKEKKLKVELRYSSASRNGAVTTRIIDVMDINRYSNYVEAYCYLRNATRFFNMSRIIYAKLLHQRNREESINNHLKNN